MIIFGNGSMARVLYDYIKRPHIVFYADDEFVKTDTYHGHPLMKFSKLLEKRDEVLRAPCAVFLALGFHGMNSTRRERLEQLRRCGCLVQSYIDLSVKLRDSIRVGCAVIIYDNTVIHAGSSIEDNVFISSNVSIGHDCKIGAHSWINSGVALGGGVELGERCVLGMNCTIAQGVKLGEATFVGANTLVTRSTKPGAVVVSEHGIEMAMDSERFLKLTRQP